MADHSNSVELYVFGLKDFLPPEGVCARADLDLTWYDYLNTICGVQVGPEDGVMVCTNSYSNPRKRGWSADLSEKIGDFIEKFSIRKDRYSIRLMTKLSSISHRNAGRQRGVGSSSNSKPRSGANATMSCNAGSTMAAGRSVGRRRYMDVLEPRTFSNATSSSTRPRASTNARERNVSSSRHTRENGTEDNYVSSTTVAPMRNNSRRSRIQRDDLLPVVKERLQRFNNPLLLRVLHEMKRLQSNKLWDRNVMHAPMSSYFLQEVFSTD